MSIQVSVLLKFLLTFWLECKRKESRSEKRELKLSVYQQHTRCKCATFKYYASLNLNLIKVKKPTKQNMKRNSMKTLYFCYLESSRISPSTWGGRGLAICCLTFSCDSVWISIIWGVNSGDSVSGAVFNKGASMFCEKGSTGVWPSPDEAGLPSEKFSGKGLTGICPFPIEVGLPPEKFSGKGSTGTCPSPTKAGLPLEKFSGKGSTGIGPSPIKAGLSLAKMGGGGGGIEDSFCLYWPRKYGTGCRPKEIRQKFLV